MATNDTKDTKKQNFLEAFRLAKCNISKACEVINIERKTFYRWQEKYPKFSKAIKDIEDSMTDRIEVKLMTKAEEGHQRAMEFYLTNRKKEKYSNTFKGEFSGPGGEPLKIITELAYKEPDKGENGTPS
jgi:hypothetical protein